MSEQAITGGTVLERFPASFSEGWSAQDQFVAHLRGKGFRVETSSSHTDRVSHIDLWAWIDGRTYAVDFKGIKRLQRYAELQSSLTCLELHGAHENNRGWLFGGRADLIAFEQEDSYILAWRDRLVDLVEFMVSPEIVDSSSKAVYKVYSRRDCEEITWVETKMLRHEWVLFKEFSK